MAKRSIKYDEAKPNSGRGISANQWNGLLGMHKDYYGTLAGGRPVPPVLQNSVIVTAVLREGSEPIDPYAPVRITKQFGFVDIGISSPSYEVEAVDSVDDNGDPTARHGNYGFSLAEGITEDSGGRVVIAGAALALVTREQFVEGADVDAHFGTPFDGYEGSYDASYYVVPDGTILEDTEVLVAPVGHFTILSWYDVEDVKKQAPDPDSPVFVLIDLSRRFGSGTVEVFGTVPAFEGAYQSQNINQTNAFFQVNKSAVPEDITDVSPRVSNNGNYPATPSMVTSQSSYFKVLVTNTFEVDVPTGLHTATYSDVYNRLIFSSNPTHNDGRIPVWYGDVDATRPITRGHVGGLSLDSNYTGTNISVTNTDTILVPYSEQLTKAHFSNGQMTFASDYQTGGNQGSTIYSNNAAHTAGQTVSAMVYVLDFAHEYATFCQELGSEGCLISAPWGEFKCIDKYDNGSQYLHNEVYNASPHFERWSGLWQNQSIMSEVFELSANGTNALNVNHAQPATPVGMPEVDWVTIPATALRGMTRLNHTDNMPQPQYQAGVVVTTAIELDVTSFVIKDSTNTDCLSPTFNKTLPAASVLLKAVGVKADGTLVTLGSHTWNHVGEVVVLSASYELEVSIAFEYEWTEEYKYVYLEYSSLSNCTATAVGGTCTLHRMTNYNRDDNRVTGITTTPTHLGTLPTWPTYANGDIESAGKFN